MGNECMSSEGELQTEANRETSRSVGAFYSSNKNSTDSNQNTQFLSGQKNIRDDSDLSIDKGNYEEAPPVDQAAFNMKKNTPRTWIGYSSEAQGQFGNNETPRYVPPSQERLEKLRSGQRQLREDFAANAFVPNPVPIPKPASTPYAIYAIPENEEDEH